MRRKGKETCIYICTPYAKEEVTPTVQYQGSGVQKGKPSAVGGKQKWRKIGVADLQNMSCLLSQLTEQVTHQAKAKISPSQPGEPNP